MGEENSSQGKPIALLSSSLAKFVTFPLHLFCLWSECVPAGQQGAEEGRGDLAPYGKAALLKGRHI